jgi:hypothetical protein
MEHSTQDSVEKNIFSEIHEKRYTLAGEAPICNGELFQDFGYTANTKALFGGVVRGCSKELRSRVRTPHPVGLV